MYRASVFVWQFQEALSTRQHISLKISTKIIFDLSQWQQNNTTTDKKKDLPFLLSSWQCFAGILPLSQWLCRKSTMWSLSWRSHRHFSPVKEELCKWIQHCGATLRRSRNKRNVGSCWLKSLTAFKLRATTCNRVCKRSQHVTSNNVGSCWPTILCLFARGFSVVPVRLLLSSTAVLYHVNG